LSRKELAYILILVFLSLFLFTFKLGGASLFETDEYIYTSLAKEIVESGDWLTLRLNGMKWFVHPPLYMWLTAIAGAIFGFSEFIARIWCSLFGVGLVIVTYFFGKLLFNQRTGFLSGLILATSLQFMIQSRLAIFDVPLIFFIVLAVYFFFSALKPQNKNLYYLFYVSMGLGILTKGPIAAVLPALVIFTYILITKEFRIFKEAKIIAGFFITLAVGGSWYFAALAVNGREFWDIAIMHYTIGRYFGVVETHTGPFWSYIPVVFLGFLPWTSFLPAMFAFLIKERKETNIALVLTWITFVFVFFSLAGTKLPGYIMSIYPFLAIGLGASFDQFISEGNTFLKKWVNVSFIILFILSLGLAFLAWYLSWNPLVYEYHHLVGGIVPILVALSIGGIASASIYVSLQKLDVPIAMLVLSMGIFVIFFTTSTVPAIEMYKPQRPLARKIASLTTSNDLVIGYGSVYKTSFDYYLGREIKWYRDEGKFLREFKNVNASYCLIGEKAYEKLKGQIAPYTTVVDKKADVYLLSVK